MKKSWLKLALCVGVCAALGAVCFMGACGSSSDDDLSNETFKEREFKSSDLDTFKTGMSNSLNYEGSYTLTAGIYEEYDGETEGMSVTYALDKDNGKLVGIVIESYDGDEDGGYYYYLKTETQCTYYYMSYEKDADGEAEYEYYGPEEFDGDEFDEMVEYNTVSALAEQFGLTDVSDITDEDGIVEYISDYFGLDEDTEVTLAVEDGSSGSVEYVASWEETDSYGSYDSSVSIVINDGYVRSITIDEVATSSDNETETLSVPVTISYEFDDSLWPDFDAWTDSDED